jgi:hypothetical protein
MPGRGDPTTANSPAPSSRAHVKAEISKQENNFWSMSRLLFYNPTIEEAAVNRG